MIVPVLAELGESSEEEHRELLHWINTLDVDRVLLVGPNFYQVCEPSDRIAVFKGRGELETYLREEHPEGHYILLKGSRVMELEVLKPLLID